MIKSNKVINAVLLPKVLSLAVLISFVTTAGIYVTQENKPETADISVKNVCLLGLVALLIICIGADVYSDYKKHENFSSLVVRKYLKKELGKHPELKQFEKNLVNPKAMQDVSTLVFNSLRPSERKLVAQIILDVRQDLRNNRKYGAEDIDSLKTSKVFICAARNKIVEVLKEHTAIHPEFISDIYSVMARADMIYMVQKNSIKQNTK